MIIIRPYTVSVAALTSNVPEADYTAHSLSTVYPLATRVISNHEIYESLTGSSALATISIATPALVGWVAHGKAVNTPVSFSTDGALPTGVVAGTVYYIIATGLTADAFEFSATVGGAAINTSGTQSGNHTATASTNYNKDPATNPTYWLDVGATNRWKMFDRSVQSQTSNADTITVSVALTDYVNTVALVNISAASARVTLTDAVEGVVYDVTTATVSTAGVYDAYTYFFEPIVEVTEVSFADIPPYASATLSVTLSRVGFTPLCGVCILGKRLTIGDTEVGAKVGIQDYSIKQQDAFGNYTIVQRAYAKRANFTVTIDSAIVDQLQNLLASYRATPIAYIGTTSYGSTLIYGFYKSFEIDIGYVDGTSVATLEVEGLT